MEPEAVEELLLKEFSAVDEDTVETYVWGPEDPDGYFGKFVSEAELKADFEEFCKGNGVATAAAPMAPEWKRWIERMGP